MYNYTNHEIIFNTKSIDGDVVITESTWSGSKGNEIHYIVTLNTGCISTSKTATFKSFEKAMARAKKYTDWVMANYCG